MNRKLLSIAALALVAALSTPLVQADDDDDDDRHAYREVRVHSVEKHYYRDDRGHHNRHRHWRKPKHHSHHDYDEPAPRVYRESYPARRTSSPVPIIAGSVIGGVVGHDLGRGDPRDTAIGAVVGTIIGYQIVRHRD